MPCPNLITNIEFNKKAPSVQLAEQWLFTCYSYDQRRTSPRAFELSIYTVYEIWKHGDEPQHCFSNTLSINMTNHVISRRIWSAWRRCGWTSTRSSSTSGGPSIGTSRLETWQRRRTWGTGWTARTSSGSWRRWRGIFPNTIRRWSLQPPPGERCALMTKYDFIQNQNFKDHFFTVCLIINEYKLHWSCQFHCWEEKKHKQVAFYYYIYIQN